MQQATRLMHHGSDLSNRLNHAGLVIREHHGDQRPRHAGKPAAQRVEVDLTLRIHFNLFDQIRSEAAATDHRRMLYRGDE